MATGRERHSPLEAVLDGGRAEIELVAAAEGAAVPAALKLYLLGESLV